MRKKRVLILQGGENEEHDVSLTTAKEVNIALIKLGYMTQFLDVRVKSFEKDIKNFKIDYCFNALHGTFGEDGQVQNILYNLDIPFTHSGALASDKCFNKDKTKQFLKKTNVGVLESLTISSLDLNKNFLNNLFLKFNKFIIKPVSSGSSYGIQIIRDMRDIENLLKFSLDKKILYEKHKNFIVEPYVLGKELTVTVIENNNEFIPVEVTEIIPMNNFFDYEAKYTKGFAKHIIPAILDETVYKKCLNNAKTVHETIGCNGISRSDFIFDEKNNELYCLEINNQPGLTPISLVPEQLNSKGIGFIDLIDRLIKLAKCQE